MPTPIRGQTRCQSYQILAYWQRRAGSTCPKHKHAKTLTGPYCHAWFLSWFSDPSAPFHYRRVSCVEGGVQWCLEKKRGYMTECQAVTDWDDLPCATSTSELICTLELTFLNSFYFSAGWPNSMTFTFGVAVTQLFSTSISRSSSRLPAIHAYIHIASAPLAKLLSLPVNSAMLSLALDPKGNTVNNERHGKKRRAGEEQGARE